MKIFFDALMCVAVAFAALMVYVEYRQNNRVMREHAIHTQSILLDILERIQSHTVIHSSIATSAINAESCVKALASQITSEGVRIATRYDNVR